MRLILLILLAAVSIQAKQLHKEEVCTPSYVFRGDTKAKFMLPKAEQKFKYLKVIGNVVYFDGSRYDYNGKVWINTRNNVEHSVLVGKKQGKIVVCETSSMEPGSVNVYFCKRKKQVSKKKSPVKATTVKQVDSKLDKVAVVDNNSTDTKDAKFTGTVLSADRYTEVKRLPSKDANEKASAEFKSVKTKNVAGDSVDNNMTYKAPKNKDTIWRKDHPMWKGTFD